MNPQTSQIWYIPRKKNIFNQPDDILTAAEKYIEEHGTEAFERMIIKVHIVLGFFFLFPNELIMLSNLVSIW